MLRSVKLPTQIAGHLFLHGMPGRSESLDRVWREIGEARINSIVSLAGLDEVRERSPEYAKAIVDGSVPCERLEFPVPDYGVPDDRAAFYAFARDLAERLRVGGRLLVHCYAGIGRTGTLAVCILLALGEPPEDAKCAVATTGSAPVTPEQDDLLAWFASQVSASGEV